MNTKNHREKVLIFDVKVLNYFFGEFVCAVLYTGF